MSYLLTVSESDVLGKGKYANAKGNTECVVFVCGATDAPATTSWKKGIQVKGSIPGAVKRGTAIATFDDAGKYPTDTLGKHGAVYLSHDSLGINVLDQWNAQGQVLPRKIRFGVAGSRSNNGDTFYVIELVEDEAPEVAVRWSGQLACVMSRLSSSAPGSPGWSPPTSRGAVRLHRLAGPNAQRSGRDARGPRDGAAPPLLRLGCAGAAVDRDRGLGRGPLGRGGRRSGRRRQSPRGPPGRAAPGPPRR